MQQEVSGKPRAWRILRRTGRWLAILLATLGAAGAAWNGLAIRHAHRANPPPGRIYDVNGYAMHLYCTGAGTPTLLLESGHGEDFTVWGKVQPGLARITRTCSYDRAGFGWSVDQPGERDAAHIADQLHGLLTRAGIRQVVLMAHSAGGLYARVYAAKFPQSVAGMVLVDAATPKPLPAPPFAVALDHHSSMEFAFVKAAVALGVTRLLGQCDYIAPGLEGYAGWIKANECYYPALDAYVREDHALDDSRQEAARTGPFGNLPLLVLSQDAKRPMPAFLSGRISAKDWSWSGAAHDAEQAAFLKLSTRSSRAIAPGSGHYIQYDRPDVLIQETAKFIHEIRSENEPGT